MRTTFFASRSIGAIRSLLGALMLALFGMTALGVGQANADPVFENIVSDSSWRSNETELADWETVGFDHSLWPFARAPYPSPADPKVFFGSTTTAQHMWHDPNNISDGTTGVIRAFLRKTFSLNIQADSLPLIGQALISTDDDYEFYVNGTLVFENKDGGFADQVDLVDFTAHLANGANVFAIEAVDGAWNNPRDRIYERVLFDATIATVPEPSTVAVFGVGLAVFGFAMRRRMG